MHAFELVDLNTCALVIAASSAVIGVFCVPFVGRDKEAAVTLFFFVFVSSRARDLEILKGFGLLDLFD